MKKYKFIIIPVLLACLMAIFFIKDKILLESFEELERLEARKDIARVVDAVDVELTGIEKILKDWAVWDDSYEYVQNPSDAYIQSNLGDDQYLMESLQLNMIFVLNARNEILWGKTYDERGEEVALPDFSAKSFKQDHVLLGYQKVADINGVKGLWVAGERIILIASHAVLKNNGDGPARGTIIFGRIMEPKFLARLAEQTKVPFEVEVVAGQAAGSPGVLEQLRREGRPVLREDSREYLSAYAFSPSLNEKGSVLIRAEIKRSIMNQGWAASRMVFFSLVLVLLVLSAFFLWVLSASYRYTHVVESVVEERTRKLKEHEQVLSLALAVGRGGMCLLETEGNGLAPDENFLRLFGFADADSSRLLTRNDLKEFFDPKDWDDFNSRLKSFLSSSQEDQFSLDKKITRWGGEQVWLSFRGKVLSRNDRSLPSRVMLIGVDVTDRRRQQAKLEAQVKQLQAFQDLVVGRELKMVEMKKEISKLCHELGRKSSYE